MFLSFDCYYTVSYICKVAVTLLLSFAHRTRKIMSFYPASISSLVLHPFVVGKFCFSRH